MAEQQAALVYHILAAKDDPRNSLRVIALMGPNGSGKSNLLRNIENVLNQRNIRNFRLPAERRMSFNQSRPFGRLVDIPEAITRLTSPEPPGMIRGRHEEIRFDDVIGALLLSAYGKDVAADHAWKESLAVHVRAGKPLPREPPKHTTALEQLLTGIIGHKARIVRQANRAPDAVLEFTRSDGVTFGLQGLSDGEKQIIMLSIFLGSSGDEQFIFLADEPELYLNEARAIEVWESIERHFPAAVFLHATHNVAFATRETVDATYLLRPAGELETVDKSKPVPAAVIREMVGARLQVLRSTAPLVFCEDELSKLILEDLLGDQPVQVIPLAGCESVKAAVQGEPGWEQVRSGGAAFCGVIDRDARTNDEVDALERRRILCLPVWDAEAVLLAPEIATWMISRLLQRKFPIAEYMDIIGTCANERRDITLHRVSQHLCWREKPELSFDSGGLNPRSSAPANLVALFSDRVAQIQKSVDDRDAPDMLRLHLGKMMYRTFVRQVKDRYGLVLPTDNPIQKYVELRETKGFLDVLRNIEWMAAFRQKVESRLRESTGQLGL